VLNEMPAICFCQNIRPSISVNVKNIFQWQNFNKPGHDADLSPRLVPRSRMSSSYTSSPLKRLHCA
jgi:hypothetical protein